MAFSQLFAFRSVLDRTAEMAERVAGRSRMAVWQRVKDGLATLEPVQARGYIRARAISVVKEETSRLIEQEGVKVARQRARIEAAATEMLVAAMVNHAGPRRALAAARRAA
jgi:hypothetical protein